MHGDDLARRRRLAHARRSYSFRGEHNRGSESLPPRAVPPFRADHVGSLLRPPRLREARAAHAAGRLDDEGLRAVEDDAVREAVAMQEGVGLRSITDGELRRGSWHMDFIYALGGVEPSPARRLRSTFRNERGTLEFTPTMAEVTGRLRLERTIFAEDFEFLAGAVRAGTPKLTIPAPSMLHYRGGRAAIDASVYPEMDAFWAELAAVYAEEIRRLAALGCTYLQLDDISFAYLNDPAQRAMFDERGEDGEHAHLAYIEAINAALRERPPGMTIATHMCRGNFRSSWVASGGYEHIAEAVFGTLAVDAFFLEYDDERSGSFAPLRFVAPGKVVVLGLVSSKRAALEGREGLLRRIEEASAHIDVDRLCLSPQCGFSSTEEGNELTADEQRAKLALVVETAAEVWGER